MIPTGREEGQGAQIPKNQALDASPDGMRKAIQDTTHKKKGPSVETGGRSNDCLPYEKSYLPICNL